MIFLRRQLCCPFEQACERRDIIIADLIGKRLDTHISQFEQALGLLNAQISEEKDKITVLEADWSYLTRPARIQQLSREMLSFAPVEPERILTLDALDTPSSTEDEDNNLFQIKTIQGVE